MKSNSLVTGITLMLASAVLLYACQKQLSGSASRPNPSISASTTNAAVGEKVSLTVANAPEGTHLLWASTAASAASFSANGLGSANISFNKPGTYTVTAYFVSGAAADSLPNYDTSWYPHDTVPNPPTFPPPPPPYDTTSYPHDTTGYPHDTTGYPHDTLPNYPPPHDTTGYPHDTTGYPHDTTITYPHDTFPSYPPHDSTYYPHDSTGLDSIMHANHGHITGKVTIIIVVH